MKFKSFNILLSKTLLSCFAFLTLCTTFTHAQSDQELDSLMDWSYEELLKKYDDEAGVDNSKALLFGKAYLKKARFDKDTIKIANAFTQLAIVSDYKNTLEYCDSIIALTKNSPSKEYPGWGYLVKGGSLLSTGKYEEALYNSSKAYKAAIQNNNEKHIFYLNQEIGKLKIFWSDAEDAISIYKNQLNIISKTNNKYHVNSVLETYFNLTNAFIIQKNLDSSKCYNNIGLKLSLKNVKNIFYPYFLSQAGEILFYENKFSQSKDSLNKAIKHYNDKFSLKNSYTLLGKIELESNDTLKAIQHFQKADSILSIEQDYTPESKNIHSFLRDYYLQHGDSENFKIYDTKLKRTDSILTETYKLVNRKLIEDFEIPKIINEKDKTIKSIKKNSIISENVILFVGVVAIFGVLLIITYIKRNNKKKSAQKKNGDPLKSMSPEVVDKIMKQLDRFEKNKKFTAKNISAKSLAKKFNTNSSYLSKVVNNKKKQHFSNYISDLRINYCIEQLDSNKKYHLYDIKSLANEFGYRNSESFSKAFIKKTGTTPSSYIQNLGNSEK